MHTKGFVSAVMLALAVMGASVAPVQAQQTLNFTLGGFVPLGWDARDHDDVLVADQEFLAFRFGDFHDVTAGAEWLIAIGPILELGAGASWYSQTVPTVYYDYFASDNTEIEQELRLQMLPVSFTARIVPTGQRSPVQPYFGGGIAIINWRYQEIGDFVDFGTRNLLIRPGNFVADGTEVGPVVLGGIRFVSDLVSVGGEVRYQHADANLDGRFAGSRLDLGGWTYQATLGLRFGN